MNWEKKIRDFGEESSQREMEFRTEQNIVYARALDILRDHGEMANNNEAGAIDPKEISKDWDIALKKDSGSPDESRLEIKLTDKTSHITYTLSIAGNVRALVISSPGEHDEGFYPELSTLIGFQGALVDLKEVLA